MHIVLLVIGGTYSVTWNIPTSQENFLWQKEYILWQKEHSICHRRNYSCETKNISCHRKQVKFYGLIEHFDNDILYQVSISWHNTWTDICLCITRMLQGGIITGNLGTKFPWNLKVSHEIFIVNLTHLSRSDTPKRWPNLHMKIKIVLVTENILLVHIEWILCKRRYKSCYRMYTLCHRKK